MKYGSGCTGIGGFDLGFDRAGWECAWQIENAKYPNKVLEKHWQHVVRHTDVRECGNHNLSPVDVFCFGFPCTDLSISAFGSHEGLGGTESGLFFPLARIAREIMPQWIVIENVAKVKKYIGQIASELPHWELEYADLTASDFGAYTRRVRTFIVGHPRNRHTSKIFDRAALPSASFQSGGGKDVLPMCLPWKGGLSLERLGSCVMVSTQTYSARIRKGDGLPGRMDGHRYLAVGNSVSPLISEWIARRIDVVSR